MIQVNHTPKQNYQNKDTKELSNRIASNVLKPEELRTFHAFFSEPKTMQMVSHETGIQTPNICRYVDKLKQSDKIFKLYQDYCKVSKKHKAWYYTTNGEIAKNRSINLTPSPLINYNLFS